MSKNRRRARASDASATWWIVGLMAVMVVIALIALNGIPGTTRDRALVPGTSQGSPDAPVVLEEYADFQCPACGLFARTTLPQIEDKYVAAGKVRIEFHHFAFIGNESIRAGEAAECAADQNSFWQYYDTLFNKQGGENVGAFSDDKLLAFATELKLDTTTFQQCLSDRRYQDKVQRDTADGRSRGVNSTPTLFINGRKVAGVISITDFDSIVAPLLGSTP